MKLIYLSGCNLKAMKILHSAEGNELSKFSDPPGDAYLDDLFPLDKRHGEVVGEASTSASTSHMAKGNVSSIDGGEKDLAKELRATIARKQWEKESEIGQANNGGNLLHRVMIGVLKDDVIDIDGLVCSIVFILKNTIFLKIPCLYPSNLFLASYFDQVFDEKLPGENLFPLQVRTLFPPASA